MPNPKAAMLVIGDEILSGRTKDVNVGHLAEELTKNAIDLAEVRMVPDIHEEIVAAVQALSGRYDYVFTSGGIGPTHDDITADAVAAAFDDPIDVRADARALLEKHYNRNGVEINEARLRMARIPASAELIDNPVSIAPGFRLKNVHVMAGVPAVFRAMVETVIPSLTGGDPVLSQAVRVNRPEGDIAEPLGRVARDFPDVSVGSYPYIKDGQFGANLVVRSTDPSRLDAAIRAIKTAFPEAFDL